MGLYESDKNTYKEALKTLKTDNEYVEQRRVHNKQMRSIMGGKINRKREAEKTFQILSVNFYYAVLKPVF
ncbi:MAG: hypothetical protein LBS26_02545 [Campylobacteraceae bacterium]|jgi:hypothetical protein|nr:hypothetical protein [Campylobacteraceae bacterium]